MFSSKNHSVAVAVIAYFGNIRLSIVGDNGIKSLTGAGCFPQDRLRIFGLIVPYCVAA